jgi:hypothetical protein
LHWNQKEIPKHLTSRSDATSSRLSHRIIDRANQNPTRSARKKNQARLRARPVASYQLRGSGEKEGSGFTRHRRGRLQLGPIRPDSMRETSVRAAGNPSLLSTLSLYLRSLGDGMGKEGEEEKQSEVKGRDEARRVLVSTRPRPVHTDRRVGRRRMGPRTSVRCAPTKPSARRIRYRWGCSGGAGPRQTRTPRRVRQPSGPVSTASSVRFSRATRLLQPTDKWARMPLYQ